MILLLAAASVLLGGLLPFKPVIAQEDAGRAVVTAVNSESFPEMMVEFEVHDPLGGFVTDLDADDVRIRENGQIRQVETLELLQPGVQLTIAFNLSPELANRYNGTTRLEGILLRLNDWVKVQKAENSDRLSLATNTGLQLIRSSEPQEWTAAFEALASANLNGEQSSLNALIRAVDLATETRATSAGRHAILYITPLPNPGVVAGLANLAQQAAAVGVPIFVWLVGSASSADTQPELYAAAETLATQTGGSLFLYSGQETLPDPDGYLNPLRYIYQAGYVSEIQASADYEIQVEINTGEWSTLSEPWSLLMDVQPPNPIFLAPPSEIERTWQESTGSDEAKLVPGSINIQILVEFPDGYNRPLRATRLFVDGEPVVENTAEPFDVLPWDLSAIQTNGRHVLTVEVEDTLGLTRRSIDMPVDIMVEPASPNFFKAALTGSNLLILGGVLAAGAALVLGLGWIGRRAGRRASSRRGSTKPGRQSGTFRTGLRPVPVLPDHSDLVHKPHQHAGGLSSAPAWLLRLPDNAELADVKGTLFSSRARPASAILLYRSETNIGSDGRLVNFRIDSPSVSPLHTRICQIDGGEFQIFDAGSVAGTWVNYSPVPEQGLLLCHGDLVQIGRVAFRFELANPPESRHPQIIHRKGLS